jgi:hypothetical protein
MATTKKKAVKKKVVKKAVKKKAAKKAIKKTATKKPVNKKTSKKTAKKASTSNSKIKVTFEQHHKMICEAAYYISLDKTYETVNPTDDWLQAETFINKICTVRNQ